MKLFLSLILAVAAIPSLAMVSRSVDLSSTNLASTYVTTSAGLYLSGLPKSGPKGHIFCSNTSAGAVACYIGNPSTTVAPSSGDGTEIICPATAMKAWDGLGTAGTVYCRSATGSSITSGILTIEVWE